MRVREAMYRYGVVAALLAMVALGSLLTMSSCGSGGGSSNGGLCEQCGDTDGPCQDSVTVTGDDATALCNGQPSCDVNLECFRGLSSAQRRCFPADAQFADFKCDGERPFRNTPTPVPSTTPTDTAATATPTATVTEGGPTATGSTPATTASAAALTPTPAPTATPVCGNGILEDDEECDGNAIDNSGCDTDVCTCADFCDPDSTGSLSCNADCTLNFSHCTINDDCEFF